MSLRILRSVRLLFVLLAVLGTAACGQHGAGEPDSRSPAQVRMELEARSVDAGEPIRVEVHASSAEGVDLEPGAPAAEGLEARKVDEEVRQEGGRTRRTLTWALEGEPGSYVIRMEDPVAVLPNGEQLPLSVSPLFVDLGVQGPRSDLADIAVLEPEPPPRWPWFLAAGLAGAALVALLWLLYRRRRAAAKGEREPEPADRRAIQAWIAVMEDESLDDHARALKLSEVFRVYLEAIYGWSATAFTTREILHRLYGADLSASLLDRARRVLRPMDLLKYARQGGGKDLFVSLDDDFRTFVQATRPRPPSESESAGAPAGGPGPGGAS